MIVQGQRPKLHTVRSCCVCGPGVMLIPWSFELATEVPLVLLRLLNTVVPLSAFLYLDMLAVSAPRVFPAEVCASWLWSARYLTIVLWAASASAYSAHPRTPF